MNVDQRLGGKWVTKFFKKTNNFNRVNVTDIKTRARNKIPNRRKTVFEFGDSYSREDDSVLLSTKMKKDHPDSFCIENTQSAMSNLH
jgi:hypothetical protein